MTTLVENFLKEASREERQVLEFEEAYLDFTEQLTEALDARGMSQAKLAEQLNRPPSFVTKVMRGNTNPTLKTLALFAFEVGLKTRFRFEPVGQVIASHQTTSDIFKFVATAQQDRALVSTAWNPMAQTVETNARFVGVCVEEGIAQ